MLDSVHTVESKCSLCGYVFDCAAGLTAPVPKPGNVSLCMRCGAIGIFETGLSVRLATDDEVADIMKSNVGPVIRKSQAVIRSPAMQGRFRSEAK